ncbi:MAG: pantetheine-phosphate adenylyltransferase [Chloroflexota bacterium]|nr:pantetheine-phosphate adenylyltransferase [Chloroflexota bacterium]
MAKAIYPGSFDPITNGHIDVAVRAAAVFDELVVCVYDTPSKNLMFSTEERLELAKLSLADIANISVETYQRGLTIELAKHHGATAMVRGLRNERDFGSEFELALMNRNLDETIESVFIMTSPKYGFVSSTLMKEAVSLGGDISDLVSPIVLKALLEKNNS